MAELRLSTVNMSKREPNKYKLVLLAAGKGSRLGDYTTTLNKGVLPVGAKGVVSLLIEKTPPHVEVVVAVGHARHSLLQYLAHAHPERCITPLLIDRYEGPGSGPGYSLLQCRGQLQCPFILATVDTIVTEDIPAPDIDWLGISPITDTKPYNTVMFENGFVANMRDKEQCDNTHAWIGLAGIHNYTTFWKALAADNSLIAGERQLSNGLKALVESGMRGVEFTWFDTGAVANYERAARAFGVDNFRKNNEYIYFVGNRVIKYFSDPQLVTNRMRRSKLLGAHVPTVDRVSKNFYSYVHVPGETLYQRLTEDKAREFFRWLASSFWQDLSLAESDQKVFEAACYAFYHDKTLERVAEYEKLTGRPDRPTVINGIATPSVADLLAKVDWLNLQHGISSRMHGDLQFDNVIVTKDSSRPFVLIDWRQDFGGLLEVGDRYYDLAKLYGGMLMSYKDVKDGNYFYQKEDDRITFDVRGSCTLTRVKEIYEQFLRQANYDADRIRLIVGLIYLNMAPLHRGHIRQLLHYAGRLQLHQALQQTIHESSPTAVSDYVH